MNLNELPDMSDALKQVQMYEKKKLDPVGKEDGDIDNDGDVDSSDSYLKNRRKAIGKAIKKEEVEVEEGYKGKHGQSDKEYAASRSQGGKMISGDDKMSGAEYTHGRRVKAANPGMQPDVGGKTKPKSQGKMDKGTKADLMYRKANLKKEEVEQVDEADSLAAMAARREKRLAAQRKKMGTSSTGQDFGHDYGISSAERKKRQQAEFDKFVGKKTKKEAFAFSEIELEELALLEEIDAMSDEQLIDMMEDIIIETAEDIDDLIEICEHLDAVEMLSEEERDAGAMARAKLNKPAGPSRMDRLKSAAKAAGSKLKAGAAKAGAAVKKGVKAAGKSAAANAGKAVGTFQANRIKAKRAELSKPTEKKKEAPKKDDDGTGGKLDALLAKTRGTSSSSSSDSGSSSSGGGGESSSSSSSDSSSSGSTRKAVGGALRKVGSLVKKGLKKAVGKTARVVSKGSDKLAKRLGEDYDRIAHLYESGLFSIEEIENVIEEGYKPIDKKKETAMYRRAGNLSRDALSKGLSTKAGSKAQDKSGKIVSAISSQKEKERFSKMADIKARSNYGG
ncbi:hypothetical protein N440310_166 [Synechococcus phage S-CAM22]|uniref:Gp185 n=1 Tax=Synechococcus phage S-CAM22 TaxID=1883365 RepID=A0A1D8KQR4_9CAUD|nr:cytidyltransferase [Synechococcus phage S-CAM22]AOV60998.1 hypothetical protein C350210_167 [Synechococcus phage S-CAM22]AOV61212.1 hypothetical protein N440310_166 [Synechococcus phage S-CAM22]